MFDPKEAFLLKNLLGEGAEEELAKSALHKLPTNTAVEPQELVHALKIVPRAILTWLKSHLEPMKPMESKKIDLSLISPSALGAMLYINKKAPDVYMGEIVRGGEVIARLINRPLPSVGLVLMTLFELYDLDKEEKKPEIDLSKEIQDIINRRLNLHATVESIVDQKIAEINQIKNMVEKAVNQSNLDSNLKEEGVKIDDFRSHFTVSTSKSPIKKILDRRKKPEIIIAKSETHTCPDCNSVIFKNESFTPCICFGDDRNKKIFLAKTADSVVVKFSSAWEPENIEILLEAIKKKKHPHEEET